MIVSVIEAIRRALGRKVVGPERVLAGPVPTEREPPQWLPRVGVAAMAVTVVGAAVAGAVSSSALVAVTISGVLVMMLSFGMWMAPSGAGAFITVAATSVLATLAVVGGLVALSRVSLDRGQEALNPSPRSRSREVTIELTDKGEKTVESMCGSATKKLSAESVKVEGSLIVVQSVRQCNGAEMILPIDGVAGTTSK